MIEPASSVGLTALLSDKIQIKDQKIALVITSRNIAAETYNRLIA